MNYAMQGSAKLEWLLVGTLRYGTSLASAVISFGLGLALIDSRFSAPSLAILRDMRIVTIGIAMLILLPVVRVIVMLIVYFRQRDYRLAAIALLVLMIILLGFAVGLAGSRHRDATTSPAGTSHPCSFNTCQARGIWFGSKMRLRSFHSYVLGIRPQSL